MTETFIVQEILELESRGFDIELFALVNHRDDVTQPDAAAIARRGTFGNRLGPGLLLSAQWHWFRRSPSRWARAWRRAILGNLRSPSFLVRALATVPIAMAFARKIESDDIDQIHAHWGTHPALAAYVVSILTGIEYTVTIHAHDLYVNRSMLEEKLTAARAIVTISSYNRDLLSELHPALTERISVIHCGVRTDQWAPDRSRTRPGGERLIVAVGSLQPYKGHRHLIDACAAMRRAGLVYRCVIVGRGECKADLQAQIDSEDLGDIVTLAGAATSDEIRRLLAEADVFVQPSIVTEHGKTEGIPVAMMEAMACSIPTVASDVSGLSELLIDGGTGVLVPPGDHEALGQAISALLHDTGRAARLASAGRAHVLAEFDLSACIDELESLLAGSAPTENPA